MKSTPLEGLSIEYKRLKLLKDTSNDKWNSDLHQTMSSMALLLGKEGTDISLLIHYMGKPDANEKIVPYGTIQLQKNEKIMIYYWRGFHDFVYFVYQDKKVKYAKWFMWGE